MYKEEDTEAGALFFFFSKLLVKTVSLTEGAEESQMPGGRFPGDD